ncbi:tetratricopeptide repeat protein [Streptomyces sp. NPDC048420]|uniref:tetratricopeptide repeat protein n=1 Tax=Streptomyces sp. NPDC048420 TaxID=3155755 RepID=UPI00343ADC5E
MQVSDVNGDVSIHAPSGGRPLYRVMDFPVDRPTISVKRARDQPARLLQPRYAIVDFTGRRGELAELGAWRDSEDPVSTLLIHGAGGQGKTRLANRFAELSREAGWRVFLGRHGSAPSVGGSQGNDKAIDHHPEDGIGTLMVVDYAERWPTSDLLEMLTDATRQGRKARVLLLARPSGIWWQTLASDLDRLEIETYDLRLGALADEIDMSLENLFTTAQDCFARALGTSHIHSPNVQSWALRGPSFQQALAIQMAALVSVDSVRRMPGSGEISQDLGSPGQISAYLLSRERAYWEKLHDNHRVGITADAMGQATYLATLTGEQSYEDGLELLARVAVATSEPADRILKDHATAYPLWDKEPGEAYLEPLHPDLLAEDFLALAVPGHGVTSHVPDPWSTGAPRRLLTNTPSGPSKWTRPALAGLTAAAERWPHLISQQLAPLLTEHPELAVQAGGAVLATVAGLSELAPELLEKIESHLPSGQHVELAPGIAAVAYRLAHHRLAGAEDPRVRATIHSGLAQRLHYAGLREQALQAAEEAIPLWRQLAASDPVAHAADLATALSDLSLHLAALGRDDDALAASLEAVALHRERAEGDSGSGLSSLGISLNGLSLHLSSVGRIQEAVTASEEAVAIDRRLKGEGSRNSSERLASSLTNLGNHLGAVGLRGEAVEMLQEAVVIERHLCESDFSAYAPELAAVLNNLGTQLSEVGRWEDGLAATQEATDLCRHIAEANPAAHEPTLAMVLGNLGNRLAAVGRWDDALASTLEAADLYRALCESNSVAYEPDLARTLSNLGNRLAQAGRYEESAAITREAVEIRRRLTQVNPAVHEIDLAASLGNLSLRLSELGEQQAALKAVQEATKIYRKLASENPVAHNPRFAQSLSILGNQMAKLGRRDEALTFFQEAVSLCRRLARDDPSVFEAKLAMALWALAQGQTEGGAEEDLLIALDAVTEALSLFQRLDAGSPSPYGISRLGALGTLSLVLRGLGRSEEADQIARYVLGPKEE